MTPILKAPDTTSVTGSPLLRFYRSAIGKKLLTGVTGLALATFVLVHMLGNLLLFLGRQPYNAYAHHLASLGPLLYAIEGVLLVAVLLHGAIGVEIYVGKRRARADHYQVYQSVGKDSYQSVSSRTMIISGTVLAGFLVAHLATFKFGPYYPTDLNGETVRDLARLVVEVFHKLPYTLGYSMVLGLLGLHLRHGIWSAFQSIGALEAGIRPAAYSISLTLAGAIALGFLVLPWAVYLGWIG